VNIFFETTVAATRHRFFFAARAVPLMMIDDSMTS
jgi:hypothetical protein